MPGLKAQPPAQNRGKSVDSRRVARDGIRQKMTNFVAAELPKPDPQQVLRKRLRTEMEALRGLVKKAEILAGKAANNVARADTKEELEAACAKKRKAMPVAKIVESRMLPSKAANDVPAPRRFKEARRFLDADTRPEATEKQSTACAKKRKTMPQAEIVERRTPKREIVSRGSFVSSLSTNMPTHAKEVANTSVPICQSPDRPEEGEIVEEGGDDEFIDICGGASPVSAAHDVRCSSPGLLEFKKTEEDDVLVVGEASPVDVKKFTEAEHSPSNSSGSSSSGSSCGDSSDSDSSSSSGSSCSDSSDSDSSNSDDDAESVGSSPAPASVPAKRNASPDQVSSKVLCSLPCSREEGEIPEDECIRISPVATEKFAETGNSPISTSGWSRSAYDESVGSSPAPIVLPNRHEAPEKPTTPQTLATSVHQAAAVPEPPMSNLLAKARIRMRQLRREPKRQKAYEELEAMETNAVPTNWIHPMYMMEFGITVVEYVVTSDRFVPGRGGPLEQLFGLSWKGE